MIKSTDWQIATIDESLLDQLVKIEQSSFEFPWSCQQIDDCFKANYQFWGIFKQKQLIGYMIAQLNRLGEASLLNIVIEPGYRRQGAGRRLLSYLLEYCISQSSSVIFLEVRQSNLSAQALYETLGFNEIGLRKGYYPSADGREDAVIMAKELMQ